MCNCFLTPTMTQREASATLHSPRNHGLVCATLFPRWHSRMSLATLCLCLCHHQGSGPSQSPPWARHTGTFLSSIFYQMTNALPSPAVCPPPPGSQDPKEQGPYLHCIAGPSYVIEEFAAHGLLSTSVPLYMLFPGLAVPVAFWLGVGASVFPSVADIVFWPL